MIIGRQVTLNRFLVSKEVNDWLDTKNDKVFTIIKVDTYDVYLKDCPYPINKYAVNRTNIIKPV